MDGWIGGRAVSVRGLAFFGFSVVPVVEFGFSSGASGVRPGTHLSIFIALFRFQSRARRYLHSVASFANLFSAGVDRSVGSSRALLLSSARNSRNLWCSCVVSLL